MKPSKRIAEHFNRILKEHPKAKELIYEDPHHQWKVEIAAIKDYLDEQYEAKNPQCFCKEKGCDKNEHTYKVGLT